MNRASNSVRPFRSNIANFGLKRPSLAAIFGRSGVAAIELGLVSPLLLIMLTGIVEIGMAGFQAMQVQAAVQAGAIYAVQNGSDGLTAVELTAIGTAVESATGTAGIKATPTPQLFSACRSVAGVGSPLAGPCTTCCASSSASGQYVTVSAALAHTTMMPFLNLPWPVCAALPVPVCMTATTTVRIQ